MSKYECSLCRPPQIVATTGDSLDPLKKHALDVHGVEITRIEKIKRGVALIGGALNIIFNRVSILDKPESAATKATREAERLREELSDRINGRFINRRPS